MRYSKSFVLLFLLLFSYHVQGQQTAAYDDGTRYRYRHDVFALSLSPLALLDAYNGSAYKAGLTVYPLEQLRITFDAGGYWPQLTRTLTPYESMDGYHFRATVGAGGNAYDVDYTAGSIGGSYAYRKQSFDYKATDINGLSQTMKISSFSHFFGAYIGYHHFVTDRFNLEARMSFGVRYREVHNAQSELLGNPEGIVEKMRYKQLATSKTYRGYFHLGFRLSYVLWQVN